MSEHDHAHEDHTHDHEHEDEVDSPDDDYSRIAPRAKVADFHATGTGTRRIAYPILVTRGHLVRKVELNPSMLRLTVAGPEFAGFHSYQCDDHVKIVFAMPDGTRNDPVADDEQGLEWLRPYPPARKYTVRRFDAEAGEVDLDVVVHPGGLATEWAQAAQVGSEVVLAGPPGAHAFAQTYDHYVFAIDPTALPSLARWLEEAPADVSADVFVDHDHAHERDYPLAERSGVRITWLDRTGGSRLADAVMALDVSESTFLFAAGEAMDIKPLRRWRKERGIDALVTGYWRRGVADAE